ncbi:SDR family oxidoreductase [Mesorhizobium sp. M0437]|uniref:SDR family NAD(P)-dependent oxidoreductase n=1 Tax=Mesorhizobium sp. M0437 TaxID=2956945 RepID=UPI0033390053
MRTTGGTETAGMKRLVSKIAIVTGDGTGMGKAVALRFGREGANVVVSGRRIAELNAVVDEVVSQGGKAPATPADDSFPEQAEALVDQALEPFGSLDVIWNNAGVLGAFMPAHKLPFDEFDRLMSINLRGVFACLKYEIAARLDRGVHGAIVKTSSWSAHGAMPRHCSLCHEQRRARRDGTNGGRRGRRPEVSASTMSARHHRDAMGRAALGDDNAMRPFALHTPVRRVGESEDVADVVLWLLSNDARFVTGQSILVEGGYTLGGQRPWPNKAITQHA